MAADHQEANEGTESLKYHSSYSNYSMSTTIQISEETKKLISTFGSKEDTYDDIVKRLYSMAVKEQLREFLMSSGKAMTLEEAKRRHAKRWSG
jgi:predicted DNA-binding ArsR family transcriptional regulator